ncbi:MAG: SPFH domain-containing protein [Prevotella sp.]|uniref:SPFH domain-containing protein n=1 Tax=Leyella stercorea TaxID=363265 RepID=UPI001F1D4F0D|nr:MULTISPECIES: SPFH domain-containing protein [Prevotellaceae]MCF2579843.1 SPFH domain-containing protein [Leyella stercorea]MCI7184129.1 SPFH domain-containing protein [Prevotella sp.]
MENKEFQFKGATLGGFTMLFANILLTLLSIALIVMGILQEPNEVLKGLLIGIGAVVLVSTFFVWGGFVMLEPGEARVMMFFGEYKGTFTKVGYSWVNPFINTKKLSLRARNLDAEPIKVNDKTGNPVMIGLVLVWKIKDTYKAMFEIDSQTMAQSGTAQQVGTNVSNVMRAFEKFVKTQSDAALRQVAGLYAYDNNESDNKELTLRDGADEINKQLEEKLDERLSMAGIEVVEARINYLAYAPEIAAVMLRRQQADAIISAREKIVEGAVSMVKMALDKLSSEDIVELDDDKKAAMVSNLLVVLCGDDSAQPVVNTGTLNH